MIYWSEFGNTTVTNSDPDFLVYQKPLKLEFKTGFQVIL